VFNLDQLQRVVPLSLQLPQFPFLLDILLQPIPEHLNLILMQLNQCGLGFFHLGFAGLDCLFERTIVM
jgi:hypothetical protein